MTPLPQGLGRQITLSMVAATLLSVTFAIISLYVFYAIMLRVAPEQLPLPEDGALPMTLEFIIIGIVCLVTAGLSSLFAVRLARRIVAPLLSVAESARRVADGDLKARATSADPFFSEASSLVADFNRMAERLERASDAVTRWNAMIAHELRTPVTILSGRLQGLSDGVFQPEPALLKSLMSQTVALSRLIDDLRTVTLFEGGHLTISRRPVSLADEIEDILLATRPLLESNGFTVRTVLDEGICEVDMGRIHQALLALLENVRRHSVPGLVEIKLALTPKSIALQVRDSGPGLPADFIPYAFDPFSQYMDEVPQSKGSGLGLAVVRAIAETHGGTVGYETVYGGACFVINIPRSAHSGSD